MTSYIKRIRKELLPPIPRTFPELGEVLQDYAPATNIYKGLVSRGGASAIIFSNNEMLDFLRRSRWLHIDGTFSVSQPRNLATLQLYLADYVSAFLNLGKRVNSNYSWILELLLQLFWTAYRHTYHAKCFPSILCFYLVFLFILYRLFPRNQKRVNFGWSILGRAIRFVFLDRCVFKSRTYIYPFYNWICCSLAGLLSQIIGQEYSKKVKFHNKKYPLW